MIIHVKKVMVTLRQKRAKTFEECVTLLSLFFSLLEVATTRAKFNDNVFHVIK